jgi:hypothetical protein
MTFVPREIEAGDHVRLTAPLQNHEGTFSAGHEFEVIDVGVRDGDWIYELRDRNLNLLGQVRRAYVELVAKDED